MSGKRSISELVGTTDPNHILTKAGGDSLYRPISYVPAWGSITGTLSAQGDLVTALGLKEPTITGGTTAQYWRGDKSWQTLGKAAVGLSNVDNTADASTKSVASAATWTTGRTIALTGNITGTSAAFNGSGNLSFATTIAASAVTRALMASGTGPLLVGRSAASSGAIFDLSVAPAKTMLAIDQVSNTSDANRPVSTAQQTALDLKANLASPTFTGTVSAATITASGNVTGANLSGTNTGDQTIRV